MPNKGYKQSEEHKQKIRALNLGKKRSQETKRKLIGQAFFEFTKRKKVEIKLMRGVSPT